jgi:hypothetical protein
VDYQFVLSEHGKMHPDYFQGTTGVQINLYPLNHHTKGDVLDMLKMELNFQYDSLTYLFEQKGKLVPSNIEEKLELLYSELKGQINPEDQFSKEAPTEEEIDEEEDGEFPPFIFSINIDFFE